ncbi:MAG: DNA polymerase III subunit beta [Parcubacteria group bacterium ADurb.Bin326]|nr:MAG: DNA polymerase III subunit beta [Parcubacteria group bacterium ADurb.Bin326]
MKISCTQENLNQTINIVGHIASKNSNLPILSNILIKAENKNLTFSATNLEIGITAAMRGKVESDGEFSIDAKLLSSYISLLPKERIDLELADEELKIQCQKQKTKIKGQGAADFPLIPKIDKQNPYILSVKDLKDAIYGVSFSASTSDIRPELSGVFLSFNGEELVLAATDSYRLAEKKVKLISNEKQKNLTDFQGEKVIVPVKTLQEVSRILGLIKEDESMEVVDTVEIYLGENQIMFVYNGVELVSRLIEGQYPDYTQIIPDKFGSKLKINTTELTKAVKVTSLFTKSGVFDVRLDYNSDNELKITSSSSQTGENTSSVDMEKSGDSGEIVLNYRYLLDGLQNIGSENIEIEITDSNNPCVIRSENNKDYLYLIMPIRQ